MTSFTPRSPARSTSGRNTCSASRRLSTTLRVGSRPTKVPTVGTPSCAAASRLRDSGAGADWTDFVAAGCVSVVTDADGVIPLEAPHTEDAVNVQVAGRLVTTCTQGGAAGRSPQDLAATVTLRRGPGGVWLVDQQLF